MRSFSEIETTVKRATRAIGFSWGVAEEIGKSIRLLELFGLPGIKTLNHYYRLKTGEKFENLNLINKNNLNKEYPYCPIILGINFLDQIRNIEKFKKISFNKVSFPLLILPFLSRSSEIIGKKIHVKLVDAEIMNQLSYHVSKDKIEKEGLNLNYKIEKDIKNTLKLLGNI